MLTTDHIHIDPAYRAALSACGLDSVAGALARTEGRVAAWSRTTDTILIENPAGGPGFFLKRYRYPTWSKRFRGALRGTFFRTQRAEAEFAALNGLREQGIPAVRAVAHGARRIGHFLSVCFLITEEAPHACNLTTFARHVAEGRRTLAPESRRAALRGLARLVAEMHAMGFIHGNLFWRNILIRGGIGGNPEFFFIDVTPSQQWQRFVPGGAIWLRELAQLCISSLPFTSRTERLRFAREYFGLTRLDAEAKVQVLEVARLAEEWRSHETRRVRYNHLFDAWNRALVAESTRPGVPRC